MSNGDGSPHIEVLPGDLSREQADCLSSAGIIAWDIETSGLDPLGDRIASCQIAVNEGHVLIVRMGDRVPEQLRRVMASREVRKVFHHAMFDLRFMSHHWDVEPANAACTKIGARLLDPAGSTSHSLQAVLQQYLGIFISKEERLSDWFQKTLTEKQIRYAANDVLYLLPLFRELQRHLEKHRLSELAEDCFRHLPTRVRLDLSGYGDVFGYERLDAQLATGATTLGPTRLVGRLYRVAASLFRL